MRNNLPIDLNKIPYYLVLLFLLSNIAQAQNDTAQNASLAPVSQNATDGFSAAINYPGTPFGTAFCPDQKPEFLKYCATLLINLAIQNISATAVVIFSQISPDFHYKSVENFWGGYDQKLVVEASENSIKAVSWCLDDNMKKAVDELVSREHKNESMFSDGTAGSSAPCQTGQRYPFIDMTLRAGMTGLTAAGCALFLQNVTQIMDQCTSEESKKQLLALIALIALWPVGAAIYAGYSAISNGKNFLRSFGEGMLFPCVVVAACTSRPARHSPYGHH